MEELSAVTVAEKLRSAASRQGTLHALEAHTQRDPGEGIDDAALSLAAAPALSELLALDLEHMPRELWDRAALLLGKLCGDGVSQGTAVEMAVAAHGEDRLAGIYGAQGSAMAQTMRKPAAQLTHVDARSLACFLSYEVPVSARGFTPLSQGLGISAMQLLQMVRAIPNLATSNTFVMLPTVPMLRVAQSGTQHLSALAGCSEILPRQRTMVCCTA